MPRGTEIGTECVREKEGGRAPKERVGFQQFWLQQLLILPLLQGWGRDGEGMVLLVLILLPAPRGYRPSLIGPLPRFSEAQCGG